MTHSKIVGIPQMANIHSHTDEILTKLDEIESQAMKKWLKLRIAKTIDNLDLSIL